MLAVFGGMLSAPDVAVSGSKFPRLYPLASVSYSAMEKPAGSSSGSSTAVEIWLETESIEVPALV